MQAGRQAVRHAGRQITDSFLVRGRHKVIMAFTGQLGF